VEDTHSRWKVRLENVLGRKVAKLSGDISSDLLALQTSSIILSTSTNWDAISRRWKQRKSVQSVGLYIFDEVHLIGGPDGPTFEVST
jgi:pre-mRNA-splicing helicase BRR2